MNKKTEKTNLIALGTNDAEFEFTVNNNFEYSYKKQKIKLELVEEADGFTILSSKGLRYPVEIISKQQNTYEILINGVSYSFAVETPFSLKRKKLLAKQGTSSKNEIIKAPMPGKILDVMVVPGQSINSGESLLVLEAMKMQNTIASHIKGVVTKISVNAGDTVGKDDLLIEIERN
jgi:biotin carboxyl carrier protein